MFVDLIAYNCPSIKINLILGAQLFWAMRKRFLPLTSNFRPRLCFSAVFFSSSRLQKIRWDQGNIEDE